MEYGVIPRDISKRRENSITLRDERRDVAKSFSVYDKHATIFLSVTYHTNFADRVSKTSQRGHNMHIHFKNSISSPLGGQRGACATSQLQNRNKAKNVHHLAGN